MKKPNDLLYLQHIRDSLQKIQSYLQDVDEDKFFKESIIQDAVIRQLGIVGEATKSVAISFRFFLTCF